MAGTLRSMLTGVFKERGAKDRAASEPSRDGAADQALADLLSARELRNHVLVRQREIGPFLIDHLFAERAVIVDLAPSSVDADTAVARRYEARLKFLNGMGYTVFSVAPKELLCRPQRVLARLRAVLEG